MRVTIFTLTVSAVHISCIYCKPASQPGGHKGNLLPSPPPPSGTKQEPPKGTGKPEMPEKENGKTRPPYPEGENGQSPPPRPNEDKFQSIHPHPQGVNDQTASPKP
ncbi:hypothetical protein ACJMK2_026566 [Sinanodonta woodiana]|uniref:Uncharacterized protein n=1 Tax=Sinanodonta woodiana TaxID=1069815 RepID=A0ABD3XNG6_SINWO